MPKSSQDSTSQRPSRQAEGLACDECRTRKLRCDRARPTCGTCENLGVPCAPNTARQPRGPRKGHLKALQSRLSALERQLSEYRKAPEGSLPLSPPGAAESVQSPGQQSEVASDGPREEIEVAAAEETRSSQPPTADQPTMQPPAGPDELSTLQNIQPITCSGFTFGPMPSSGAMLEHPDRGDLLTDMMTFTSMHTDFDTGTTFVPSKLGTNASSLSGVQPDLSPRFSLGPPLAPFHLSELMKADLNHLFFDRVHLFAPILNRRRYFSRAARPADAPAAFVGLQHAMWTLAAWLGSQFRDTQKSLYAHTRALLEEWELNMAVESPPIELAQAWIFLAIYEIMQVNYDRGWLSAGRCFRLVQLMKLYEIDVPNGLAESGISYVEVEEGRRTFWMAYSLDRFINLINQMPLTLNEQVILTRLPAPESAFQRERPIKTQFLSKVMTGGDDMEPVSPFSACIVLTTVSGRCLSHQQQCVVEQAYGNTPQDFLNRHRWLESMIASKTKTMLASSSNDADDADEAADPMLLFANMAAQATTLLLGKAMQSFLWNYEDLITEYEQRANEAARKLCSLSQKLAEFGYFKVSIRYCVTPKDP
ncbi:Transcriptional activator protein acu-15 [Madurella mycetomatis]|uniref:Transcriptional activator protein acu-15 n=1 Tax=Madurella mycetomatis TaxID=100816 RepID=A0A175VQN7_9PEZI|nr:Transcriptional activator protein acu-15 [Madurella mycetomatis]